LCNRPGTTLEAFHIGYGDTHSGSMGERTKLLVTLVSARHLPHVDGFFGTCDAFIELEYKTQTKKSVVVKNSLAPDWTPNETFEFDLSKGELVDLKITLKDWNRVTAVKTLGTSCLPATRLQSLMDGNAEPRLGADFLVNGLDGSPLRGKDGEQTFIVLKLACSEGLPRTTVPLGDAKAATDLPSANNLFNTPNKDAKPSSEPNWEHACDVGDPTPPISNSSSRQHTPIVKSSVDPEPQQTEVQTYSRAPVPQSRDPEPQQTEVQTYSRAAPRRIRLQDRPDDWWNSASSVPPSPNHSYTSQPQSLYATDSSINQPSHGLLDGRNSLTRIRLADRGIVTTATMYMARETSLLQAANSGRDATWQNAFSQPSSGAGRAKVLREHELHGAGRVLQDYHYATSRARLDKGFGAVQLDEEWQEVRDQQTGTIFFVNHTTKQRSFVDPRPAESVSTQSIYSSAPSATWRSSAASLQVGQDGQRAEYRPSTYIGEQSRSLYKSDPGLQTIASPPASTARRSGWKPYLADQEVTWADSPPAGNSTSYNSNRTMRSIQEEPVRVIC